MTSQYFCAYHVNKFVVSEIEAFRNWSQMMQRGVKAYVECRVEAAEIYLGSSLDIALLRCSCTGNKIFSEEQLLKPAEFILQIYLMTDAFHKAQQTLDRISGCCQANHGLLGMVTEKFITEQFERFEKAEKDFFGVGDNRSGHMPSPPKTEQRSVVH
ncbi:MAG: hypothetical protein U5M23_07170 [Marinagarivorans sp.]|nr:hypothetical protein [Marinagarivorans sp.]